MNTQSMQAVAIVRPGAPDGLELVEMPMPSVNLGEVLIRVAAAGLNGPDLAQRRGHYDPPPGASPLPGLEVAGEIAAVAADVHGFAIGDRVMALTNGGGYAEYVAVPAGQVLPVPEGWGFADAAALPETWFTVTQTLVMRAGLAESMNVLVHGAAGGIGTAAIQICTILGARPIAVVSSSDKADYVQSLGVEAIIDRKRDDLVERVLAFTDGRGVDRVVDVAGGDTAMLNLKAAARGAHIVQVATLAGGSAPIDLRLLMAKQLTISGSTLRPQTPQTKAAIADCIRQKLMSGLSAPAFRHARLRTFPLADAAAAHVAMEAPDHFGKIVLLTPFGTATA